LRVDLRSVKLIKAGFSNDLPLKTSLNVVLLSALGGIYEVVNKVKYVGFNSTAVVVSPLFFYGLILGSV